MTDGGNCCGSVCGFGNGDDDWEPPTSNRWSLLLFWTVWGAVIGGLVAVLDRSLLAGGLWLAGGVLLGVLIRTLPSNRMLTAADDWCNDLCCDELDEQEERQYAFRLDDFLQQRIDFGELPEDLDHEPTEALRNMLPNGTIVAGLLTMPAFFGCVWGALLGPLSGIVVDGIGGMPVTAAIGALLGLLGLIPLLTMQSGFMLAAMAICWWKDSRPLRGRHIWLLGISGFLTVPVLYHCGMSLLRWPGERRVFAQLSGRGAIFSGDPEYSVFAVCLSGAAFGNDDVRSLRFFPSLDHIDLRGAPVDDSVVGVLARMRRLRLLELGGTHISPRGIARLRRGLPACRIML